MTIFPTCSFKVRVPKVIPGERLEGTLVVVAPKAIRRARRVELRFRSRLAMPQAGANTEIFVDGRSIKLPMAHGLARGEHRFRFAFDIPAWLAPTLTGRGHSVAHAIEARLDVPWGWDPEQSFTPVVMPSPVSVEAKPVLVRSPAGFHDTLVLEVVLDSSRISDKAPLTGRVAVRGGHDARFEAITLSLTSKTDLRVANGGEFSDVLARLRIEAAHLRGGESVAFAFPATRGVAPSFRTRDIEHAIHLLVGVDLGWTRSHWFQTELRMLPPGSVVERGDRPSLDVGKSRAHDNAAAIARATGLRHGEWPTLVEGSVGHVGLRIVDEPRGGQLGVRVEFVFPDVELGLELSPMGLLDGFRKESILPPPLGDRYLLRRGAAKIDDTSLRALLNALVDGFGAADEIELSDRHLTLHLPITKDDTDAMSALALELKGRTEAIANAISALPFPADTAAQAAWSATATEEGAFLVPHVPALHGLAFHARVISGESRTLHVSLRTTSSDDNPTGIVAEVDLREVPLPEAARLPLEREFPTVTVESPERLTLRHPSWTTDPRSLFPALRALFERILDARGERNVVAPYR